MASENPFLFRAGLHRTPWSWARLLLYPCLLIAPWLWMSVLHPTADKHAHFWGSLVMHGFYFSIMPLLVTLRMISQERDRGTWETLLSTRITTRELTSGYLRQSLLRMAPDWGVAAVLMVILRALNPDTELLSNLPLAWVYTVSCSLFFASLGAWLSAGAASTDKAQARAWSAWVVLIVGSLLGCVLVPLSTHAELLHVWIFEIGCPFVYLYQMFDWSASESLGWLPVVCQLGLALALWLLTWRKLARPSRATAPRARSAGLLQRALVQILGESPLVYRLLLARRPWWSWLVYPLLILSPVLLGRHNAPVSILSALLHFFYLIPAILIPCTLVFLKERERETWDSLVSSRADARSLFAGVALGLWLPVALEQLMWSPLWNLDVMRYGHDMNWLEFVLFTQVWVLFLASLGFCLSTWCRKSAEGLGWALSILALLSIGTVAICLVLDLNNQWYSPLRFNPALIFGAAAVGKTHDFCPTALVYALASAGLLGAGYRRLQRCLP